MDQTYIKKITWARNAVWPMIILSAVLGVAGFIQGFSGVVKPPLAMQVALWGVQLLSVAAIIIYLMGFWAIAKRYNQRKLTGGVGTLLAVTIVGLVVGPVLSYFVSQQTPEAMSIGIAFFMLAYFIAVLVAMGVGYILLGLGLKKLDAQLGPRSRTMGNLFLASGICTLTLIGIFPALILWIIAYIMSYFLFSEELARAQG